MFEGVLKSFELIILMFHARLEPKSYLSAGAPVVVARVSHPLNPHVFGRLPINYDVTRSYVFRLHGHQRAGCSRVKLQRRDQKGHTDSPLQVRVHDARRAQRGRGIGHTMYSPMVFHKNGILSPAPVLLACPDGCCPAKVRMQRAIATVEHCTHGRTCYAQVRPPGHGTAVKIFVFKKKFHCCLVQGHSIEHICCPHPQSEVIQ